MIETGLIFLNKLFNYKLIQELYLFKSGKNLKYNGSNNAKLKYLKKFLKSKNKINLDNDTLHKVRKLMFNGIIYNIGEIRNIKRENDSILISIKNDLNLKKDIGSSISCNGVCLTVINIKKDWFFLFI